METHALLSRESSRTCVSEHPNLMADAYNKLLQQLAMWQVMMAQAPALVERMNKELGQCTLQLIEEGFQKQQDPYGRPWAPKQRFDGRPILVGRTGRLRSGWRVLNMGRAGWGVAPNVGYAAAHQEPRRISRRGRVRPQRMMVPSKSRGLPRAWQERYVAVSGKAMLRAWRKVA
jgi:hypothetical protein